MQNLKPVASSIAEQAGLSLTRSQILKTSFLVMYPVAHIGARNCKPVIFFFFFLQLLTHICLMDLSILIIWMSPFRSLGVSGVLFHFNFISNRYFCKQAMKTLIKRCAMRHLIWVYTVCQCPKNGMLNLYGLI